MLDLANSGLVLLAAGMAMADVRALARDKSLRGVSMGTVVLFTAWPIWDLAYYASLNQAWSTVACCLLLAGRAAWLALALRYRGR